MIKERKIIEISDLKKITRTIDRIYGLKLSNYAQSSLKRRVEVFMSQNFSISVNNLIERIERQESFAELFIYNLVARDNEMFRDHEFWIELSHIINKEYIYNKLITFWLPDSNDHSDLYSLLIMLCKLKVLDKSDIYVSSPCKISEDKILNACISEKEVKLYSDNCERLGGNTKLKSYFENKENNYSINKELLKNVKVEFNNLLNSEISTKVDIVLFRNKMMFYNENLQNYSLKKITSQLKIGGYLAIGAKEKVNYPSWKSDYFVYNQEGNIYRKQSMIF